MANYLQDRGMCGTCLHAIQIRGDKVLCDSKRHASFMDISGATWWRERLKRFHAMELKTAESIQMGCPSWEGSKDGSI